MRKLPVTFVQRGLTARIDEQTPCEVQEIIAGGSGNVPGFGKMLPTGENLLGHNPRIGSRRAKSFKILSGIA